MRNYITFLCLFLSFFLQIDLFSAASLTILDPENPWIVEQGTIEHASISVTPSGIYSEVSITMEISDEGLYFYNDNLEIVLDFQLPEGAFVTDSWLWIGDDIIKGEMWDRWSATQIYEEIVNRNQDPSVLYKNSDIDYQLRIFPLPAGESRKIKMTYMLPGEWTKEEVAFTLPIEILNTSRTPLDKFELYTFVDSERWQNQKISDLYEAEFERFFEEGLGFFYKSLVSLNGNDSNIKYIVDAPLENDAFAQSYTHNDESYYEFVVFPNDLIDIEISNKILVLIDYDKDYVNLSKEEVVKRVEEQLKSSLGPNDYFNIIFSGYIPFRVSDTWIPYSKLDETFQNVTNLNGILSSSSKLQAVIESGVDFINEQGDEASILLVSNSGEYHELEDANEFLGYIIPYIDDIKVNVCNYHYQNRVTSYYGGSYYSGSEYLFQNIAETNFGEYVYVNNQQTFSTTLSDFIGSVLFQNIIIDTQYSLEEGLTYERFDLSSYQYSNINKPIMQVGKYIGEFPMEVDLIAIYEGEIYSDSKLITPSNIIVPGDSTLKTCWAGNHIQRLEDLPITNAGIGKIIQNSKRDRVLSLYTTLICLEPSLGGEICEECQDNPDGENIDFASGLGEIAIKDNYTVYPNPFFDYITLEFENLQDLEYIEIYDATGKLIKRFEVTDFDGNKLIWNGSDEAGATVAAGMYLLRVVTTDGVAVEKIMKK